jgi:hypothetical protein
MSQVFLLLTCYPTLRLRLSGAKRNKPSPLKNAGPPDPATPAGTRSQSETGWRNLADPTQTGEQALSLTRQESCYRVATRPAPILLLRSAA